MRVLEAATRVRSALTRVRWHIVRACAVLCALFWCSDASAYAWMIRHGYGGCSTCHVDPSGAGVLTPYGRSIGEVVLRTRYGDDAEEAGSAAEFLWAVPLPEPLMLGGDLRMLWMANKIEGAGIERRLFLMQADFEAALRVGGFVASGSIGYAEDGGFGAALTRAPEKNVVSRQHWLGYEFDSGSGLMARVGRMQIPFGIRNLEHTLWARTLTESTINDDQQHGVALAWSPSPVRTELMAILGNYQLRPDSYRERGFSGYLEWLATERFGIGASALVARRDLDPVYLREAWRQQLGLFSRWATSWEPLVVFAEADYVFRSPKQDQRREGGVGYVQLDLEPLQGLHFVGTVEAHNVGINSPPASYGLWFSQLWFFAPHADLRLDSIYQSLGADAGSTDVLTLLLQAHVYL